jgi:hypothetical protein
MGAELMTSIRNARHAAIAALGLLGVACGMAPLHAAEGGHGVYLLGLKGPGAGITPPPGLFFANTVYWYQGSNNANRAFPVVGGQTVANIRATVWLDLPSIAFVTPLEILGGNLGFSALVPLGGPSVDANATLTSPLLPGSPARALHDSVSTYGDPAVTTFLGWHAGNFHWTAGVTGFFPIGDYQKGALANVANHRGAADFNGAITWLDPAIGLDVSVAAGITTSLENTATNYRTGNELHVEGAITQNFNPQFSLGVVGYYYDQLSGDTGTGATLGAFKGRVAALGGSVGYNFKLGELPVSTRVKVYREFDVKNRLEGTAGYFTISMPLYVFPKSQSATQDVVVAKD